MIFGSLLSAFGSGMLFWNAPPDIAGGITFNEMKDRATANSRRFWSRIGFLLLMCGSLLQLTAGLIWYFEPPRFA
jgi:hypothetical protein